MSDDTNVGRVVQVRKKGGLHTMNSTMKGKSKITPRLYKQKVRDPNSDGVFEEDYRVGTLLGTRRGFCPMYSDLDKRWAWSGTPQDFARIVKKMALRYPKGHDKENQVIKVTAEDFSDHIRNKRSTIFSHPAFYGKFFLQGGSAGLTTTIPEHEFMYFCLKGDRNVDDRGDDTPKSSFTQAGTQFEIISPEKEIVKKSKTVKAQMNAVLLLSKIEADETKIRAICQIMNVTGYSKKTTKDQAFNLLYDRVATNENKSKKYAGKTPRDRFCELVVEPDERINIMSRIMEGVKLGHLRKYTDYYLFHGTKLEGITNETVLIEYFLNPKNGEDFQKLIELIETS